MPRHALFSRSTLVVVRLALVACSIVATLALVEIGLRIWQPIPADKLLPFPYDVERVRRLARGSAAMTFDADLGWIPTPDRTRREPGAVYRHNSQGLRADREYEPTAPVGLRRVAAFGDSYTYCAEVTQADCWVTRLERAWDQTETLNFGVRGYSPGQAWLRYQRDGRPYRPCAVLIGYFVEDIDRSVNRFRPFIDPDDGIYLSKPRYVLDGDGLQLIPNPTRDPVELEDVRYVEQALGPYDAWYFPGTFVKGPLDDLHLVRLARTAAYRWSRTSLVRADDRYPFYEQQGEAFQVTVRVLTQFAAQAVADGASPVVLVFPGERDLLAARHGQLPHRPLVSWLERAGVPTIDLTDVLAEEAEAVGVDPLFEKHHYSSEGNRIVARELAEQLPAMIAPTCPRG